VERVEYHLLGGVERVEYQVSVADCSWQHITDDRSLDSKTARLWVPVEF